MEKKEIEVCLHGIKKDVEELKNLVSELKEWQIRDDMKQSSSEKEIAELQSGMKALVDELKTAREDVYGLKVILAEEYVQRENFVKFSDKVVETLDKLNEKIDKSHLELMNKITEGDQKTKDDIGRLFWKVVGACIALGGFIVGVFQALLNWVRHS